ncbi:hypothetical protein PROFUN_02097 [Planoprotostelium fungivorum]|uniref:Uncharacterized protein n=1 Tax=Planoprotostelium fungivorum TaxID=1890364 RepID=A0A2P6NZ41_9EUKA|nr:hypothetical protein PROFUN_02097 [Planoprotostelium fungivorum]
MNKCSDHLNPTKFSLHFQSPPARREILHDNASSGRPIRKTWSITGCRLSVTSACSSVADVVQRGVDA